MSKAMECAVRLLSMREHGARELLNKLVVKGHNLDDSDEALLVCQKKGWQSDERFAEMLCNRRLTQGYGPLRIAQELQSKQINAEIIESTLASHQEKWEEYAQAVWQKKFKTQKASINELQKQQRFLIYRGFPREIIVKICSLPK